MAKNQNLKNPQDRFVDIGKIERLTKLGVRSSGGSKNSLKWVFWSIFLTMGFPIHFANFGDSTPHVIGHKSSTVESWEVIEPILKTRDIGLQHHCKI